MIKMIKMKESIIMKLTYELVQDSRELRVGRFFFCTKSSYIMGTMLVKFVFCSFLF